VLNLFDTFTGRGYHGCGNGAVSLGRRGLRIRQYAVRSDGDTADSALTKRLYNRTSTANIGASRVASVHSSASLQRDLAITRSDLQDMQDIQEDKEEEYQFSDSMQSSLLLCLSVVVLVLVILVIRRTVIHCKSLMLSRKVKDIEAGKDVREEEEEE